MKNFFNLTFDPFRTLQFGKVYGLKEIDKKNRHSCAGEKKRKSYDKITLKIIIKSFSFLRTMLQNWKRLWLILATPRRSDCPGLGLRRMTSPRSYMIQGKALQNWDFFEFAERYETGRFREGSETQFPKHSRSETWFPKHLRSENLQNTGEGLKIGFRFQESGFRAFPKPAS